MTLLKWAWQPLFTLITRTFTWCRATLSEPFGSDLDRLPSLAKVPAPGAANGGVRPRETGRRSMIGGSSLNARLPLTLKFTGDDRDLYGGLRLHVLHHAGEKPLYGHWMIEELRHH